MFVIEMSITPLLLTTKMQNNNDE